MRLLIDGYNLMFALGMLGSKRFGPDGFRKARNRFLNELAARLGAVEAHQTSVVFDARFPPQGLDLPRELIHKGIAVEYAEGEEGADARIELLIARHSAPKTLTVVSSDHRIRQAAARRKARALTAEVFWEELEARRRSAKKTNSPASPSPEERARLQGLSPSEAADWLETFGYLDDEPEIRDVLRPSERFAPTDDEIERIAREVDEEFKKGF